MQSGRGIIPAVGQTLSFDGMLAAASRHTLCLFCYEADGTLPLPQLLPPRGEVSDFGIVIGSEGGFSPAEADAAKEAGLSLCGLGPRILRCETAPLCVLSALLYHYEL